MKAVFIFRDEAFETLPTYGPQDAARALDKVGRAWQYVDAAGLVKLTRRECDILVLPYLNGNFSAEQWQAVVRFHAAGGSLLMLGDTPHVNCWYPYRNNQSPDIHVLSGRNRGTVEGLSEMGKKIFGEIPDFQAMCRSMPYVRITAMPGDECYQLIDCGSWSRKTSPATLIVHRGKFLGAKFGILGHWGGEPRENALGVWQREWKFDAGLLDREWAGADYMVAKFVEALAVDEIAAGIDCPAMVRAGESVAPALRVRNVSLRPLKGLTIELLADGAPMLRKENVQILAGDTLVLTAAPYTARLGRRALQGRVWRDGAVVAEVERQQYAYSQDNHHELGFGFSTYWAFRDEHLTDEFKLFCRGMKEAGAQYARVAINWEDTEPSPGVYAWAIPDQIMAYAREIGLRIFLWVFPTARGSGLGEAGVPEWVMKEPSIDRNGRAGNFPCIWSEFYRKHYFGFLEALTRRYKDDPTLYRCAYDFGNSDFPYSYHYYVCETDIFDYAPQEQAAFAAWLRDHRKLSLEEISRRWGKTYTRYEDVPVPLSENTEAWVIYDEFRVWGVYQGEKRAAEIVKSIAPDKVPPDPPGHGWGAISDILSYVPGVKARYWSEICRWEPQYVESHHSGPQWGGEPYQVGATHFEYDEGLFQSVRLNATYYTIPGPDMGCWEEDIARIGLIRRSLQGAWREEPQIAIFDRLRWFFERSLAYLGTRLDQSVELLDQTVRVDFARYKLLVLPGYDIVKHRWGGASCMLPHDDLYYKNLLDCVRRGLKVLVFPRTGSTVEAAALRPTLGLTDVTYGERKCRRVEFPESFGGGAKEGMAVSVNASGAKVILRDADGEPILVERPVGKGAFLLAGYDNAADSFDGPIERDALLTLEGHTFVRLLNHEGLTRRRVDTNQAYLWKEMIHRGERDYVLIFSHSKGPRTVEVKFKPRRAPGRIFDLATGQEYVPAALSDGWFSVTLTAIPMTGIYLSLHDRA